MPRNQSEKLPTLEGVHPRVVRFLQGQVSPGTLYPLPQKLREEYEALGYTRRIAYRNAYSDFIHAQKSK